MLGVSWSSQANLRGALASYLVFLALSLSCLSLSLSGGLNAVICDEGSLVKLHLF